MELIPLGTNGYFPSFGRETMAFLVLADELALLLDAGTGVGRLAEPELAGRLAGRRLEVVLSHYHLDHVVGLAALPALWSGPVRLHAPAAPLVDAEARAALDRLLAPPLFPHRLEEMPSIEVLPYCGERLRLGPLELRLRRQRHPGGSVGMRLGDALAYVTDTELESGTIDLARGVDTLLHEVWFDEAQAAAPGFAARGHSWSGGVAGLADRAAVRRLAPVHHHPLRGAAQVAAVVAEVERAARCEVLSLAEGEAYTLP